jgi:hypothetical protein
VLVLLARAPHAVHLLRMALTLVPKQCAASALARTLTVACAAGNERGIECALQAGAPFDNRVLDVCCAEDDGESLAAVLRVAQKACGGLDTNVVFGMVKQAIGLCAFACATALLAYVRETDGFVCACVPSWATFASLPTAQRRQAMVAFWALAITHGLRVGDARTLAYGTGFFRDRQYELMCVAVDAPERLGTHPCVSLFGDTKDQAKDRAVCGDTLPELIARHDAVATLRHLAGARTITQAVAASLVRVGVPRGAVRCVEWLLRTACPSLQCALPFMRADDSAVGDARTLASLAPSDAMRALVGALDVDAAVQQLAKARRAELRTKKRKAP